MKASVIAATAVEARAEAQKKLGKNIYISTVHGSRVPGMTRWTFTTELLG